ncbi:hypothetical protein CBS101457_003650 [Exobasidium rhododendri]|nr:hypothetical protein CBS101457_003650 [Exobasidium rhododendri]
MSGEDDEGGEESSGTFLYVAARKSKSNRRRRKGRGVSREEEDCHDDDKSGSSSKLNRRREIIAAKMAFLGTGEVGKQVKALLDRTLHPPSSSSSADSVDGIDLPDTILALGLGSVKDSKAAQMQLAFLLLVCERFRNDEDGAGVDTECSNTPLKARVHIQAEAFDPIFDEEDCDLLLSYGIKPLQENLQGRYVLQRSTFVYMPHCTKSLYENILRSNWTPEGLSRLCLCCNDLERYCDQRDSEANTPCIRRIISRLSVDHLPLLPSPNNDALNDLAIQRYRRSVANPIDKITIQLKRATLRSEEQDGDFWTLPPEATNMTVHDPELL